VQLKRNKYNQLAATGLLLLGRRFKPYPCSNQISGSEEQQLPLLQLFSLLLE